MNYEKMFQLICEKRYALQNAGWVKYLFTCKPVVPDWDAIMHANGAEQHVYVTSFEWHSLSSFFASE